jgi:hypothetical protein
MNFHIFNRISFYFHPYMKTVNAEYWNGFRRKKILEIGNFTVWVRN